MPTSVGRENTMFPFTIFNTDKSLCSLCSGPFDTGEQFSHDNDNARLCGICNDKSPPIVDIKKLRKYVTNRHANNLKKCIVCAATIDKSNHRFGDYRICPSCVLNKKCPCLTCLNLKAHVRTKFGKFWHQKNTTHMQYEFISDDFSDKNQLLLLIRKKDLPPMMNQMLFDFTSSISTKQSDCPAITVNHCDLTIKQLKEFGSMKVYDKRKKNVSTKFQWEANKGKGRIFRDYIMSYAEELLRNSSTISIPHSDSLITLQANLKDAIGKSHDLESGIFTFDFIHFFYDRIEGTKGNDWTSYVINLHTRKMSYFDRDNQRAKQMLLFFNKSLKEEWNSKFPSSEKPDEHQEYETITMREDQLQFQLPVFGEDQSYIWDTGLCSIIHSWTMTTPELFGSEYDFDLKSHNCVNTFELLDDRTVERFRQLVLIWFIGNDFNMHLCFDMREKTTVPSK